MLTVLVTSVIVAGLGYAAGKRNSKIEWLEKEVAKKKDASETK